MIGTIAVTDYDWYEFLSRRSPSEINFWTPSDRRPFSAPEFSPYLFKLKAPHRAIAGFAYFAKWSSLPDWLAWECFAEGNGCESLEQMRERIAVIRRRIGYRPGERESHIGCVLLVQPTFFPPDDWIIQPTDWRDRTVSSKGYDLSVGEGRRVWEECVARAVLLPSPPLLSRVAEPDSSRFGTPQLVKPRLGQGTFRVSVMDAYERACAATHEHSLPALEAAHIRSYADGGPHDVRNGILLRADIHRLFDNGYLTVTPDLRLQVSDRLRADYSNGRSYYPLNGTALQTPSTPRDRPAAEFLDWHNRNRYRG